VAAGHGGGGGLRAASNHPALAAASAAPPYPRRGLFSTHLSLMSLCIASWLDFHGVVSNSS
jgi:hypothetical protein